MSTLSTASEDLSIIDEVEVGRRGGYETWSKTTRKGGGAKLTTCEKKRVRKMCTRDHFFGTPKKVIKNTLFLGDFCKKGGVKICTFVHN